MANFVETVAATETETEKTMTKREFLAAVVAADVAEDLKAYAEAALAKMDNVNAARKNKPSKARLENEALAATLFAQMDATAVYTAAEIAQMLEVSSPKATAVAKVLVEQGKVDVCEAKSTSKNGGKCKGYKVVAE